MKTSDIEPGTIYAFGTSDYVNNQTPILIVDITTPVHFFDGFQGDHRLHRSGDVLHAAQRQYVGITGKAAKFDEHLDALSQVTLNMLLRKQRTPSFLPRDEHGHPLFEVQTFRPRDIRTTWDEHEAVSAAQKAASSARIDLSARHNARQEERYELLKSAAIANGIPADGIENAIRAPRNSQSMGNEIELSMDAFALLLGVELPERIEA